MLSLSAVFSLFENESGYYRFQAGRIVHFGPGMLERSDVIVEYEWSFLFSEPSEHVASVSDHSIAEKALSGVDARFFTFIR